MQGLEVTSLYVMSGKTSAMRSLCVATIHAALCDRFRGRGYALDSFRAGRQVSIVVGISRWAWLALGLRHWWLRRQTRAVANKIRQDLRVDIVVKVRIH